MLKNRGFSLIELMVTISVIGIAASTAVPMFGDFIENSRLRGAAEHVHSDLQYSRSEAIKSNSALHLSVTSSATAWCYGFATTANCNCSNNTCDRNTAQMKGVDFTNNSAVQNGLYISPNGAVYNTSNVPSSGEITLTMDDSKSISIRISRLGHTSICSSSVPGYTAC